MKVIQIVIEVREDSTVQIALPKEISAGKYKAVLVLEEEPQEELTEKEKKYFDEELKKIEENPEYGYSLNSIIQELEEEVGRKISIY